MSCLRVERNVCENVAIRQSFLNYISDNSFFSYDDFSRTFVIFAKKDNGNFFFLLLFCIILNFSQGNLRIFFIYKRFFSNYKIALKEDDLLRRLFI
jgi:hypothetical protein